VIAFRGGRIVGPDRVVEATLVVDGGEIVEIADRRGGPGDVDCRGRWLVPGFVDVHVHGVGGVDVMSGPGAVAEVARLLPRYGVTGFCPTSIACTPEALTAFLAAVAAATPPAPDAARVLGAHLESNFINPEYGGAQPAVCLRRPPAPGEPPTIDGDYTGAAILEVIAASGRAVRIVTVAPELDHAEALIATLTRHGHRVSLGHSGATYEQGLAGIEWGARHATHLFNRMPPVAHRAPGLAGAVLGHDEVTAEIVCDGVHVHPGMIRMAVRAKGPHGVLAITDGTAGAGLAVGAETRLGSRRIRITDRAAYLDDGTLAGSTCTMDAAFRLLVREAGLDVVAAARLCATSPAQALGLSATGVLTAGSAADFAVLDADFRVTQTWIAGRPAWNPGAALAVSPPGGQA
jgi:N-acetylglucosamine-6-phosphate deacetylase